MGARVAGLRESALGPIQPIHSDLLAMFQNDSRYLRSIHPGVSRSEEHTSELQSRLHLVCRLLLEKTKRRFLLRSPSAFLGVWRTGWCPPPPPPLAVTTPDARRARPRSKGRWAWLAFFFF